MLKYTLAREGQYFKGNLHTHSTVSDGDLTPEQLKSLYKANGYRFLAITDHNIYGNYAEMNEPDFLMIPGVEIDTWFGHGKPVDHVVGIGHPSVTLLKHGEKIEGLKETDAQTLINFLVHHGNEPIYAHPMWSYADPQMVCSLHGILGLEIINYSCEQEWKSGNSEFYYEHAWQKNRNVWCFGSDDAHGHVPDFCGGYISVKCKELTYDAVFEALFAGSFTASHARMGEEAPEIVDFVVEDGVAKLWCSPCRQICLNADREHYEPAFAADGKPVTYAEYRLPEGTRSVRAICIDEKRNVTWSQPILMDGN